MDISNGYLLNTIGSGKNFFKKTLKVYQQGID